MNKNKLKPQSLLRATELFNFLSDKSWTTSELNKISTKFNVRQGLHRFAEVIGYCKKENNKWCFNDFQFDPIHLRKVVELSNEYNEQLRINKIAKRKEVEANINVGMENENQCLKRRNALLEQRIEELEKEMITQKETIYKDLILSIDKTMGFKTVKNEK